MVYHMPWDTNVGNDDKDIYIFNTWFMGNYPAHGIQTEY